MKISSLPKQVSEVVLNNNGLSQYLQNLEKGRPATPRSWLYENESDTEVLHRWLKILKKGTLTSSDRTMYQYELEYLPKFGAQGKVAPVAELLDLVTEGYQFAGTPQPAIFRTKLWQEAKRNAVQHMLKDNGIFQTLRPRALKHVLDDMAARDTLESNSGYPDFGRRKLDANIEHAIAAIKSGEYLDYPAILLFRNYNGKTRPVWMYPLATNLVEGSFAQPLKEKLINSNDHFFAPWRGYEHVKKHITDVYRAGRFLSASDFAHTDAHFTKWHTLEVYDVIKYAFQPQYWSQLRESLLHVNDIDLIAGTDRYITGSHGVSSGSVWTNDIETYMDRICEEYFKLLGLVVETDTAIGDDVTHQRDSYLPEFAAKIAAVYKQMNFDVQAEKVTNLPDVLRYLQRLNIRGLYSKYPVELEGRKYKVIAGQYRTVRALNSSLNPEKFHSPKLWSVDNFCCRQFMILENCIDHYLFDEFVKFVCNGNPHLVEFAKKSAQYINAAQEKSHLVPGLNPTYNQEKRAKPMSTYESIRVARSL